MLATISGRPTARMCDVSSSIQRTVQRRTSFLIRDILGKNNEDAFDSDETEKDSSQSHLSEEQQLHSNDSVLKKNTLIEGDSYESSPQEWMEFQPSETQSYDFKKEISLEHQASPKRLSSPLATSCCRECNINNSQRIASLSFDPTLKKSLSPQEYVSDEEKDRKLFLHRKTSSASFQQDPLRQLRKKSDDFNQSRKFYVDDFQDKSNLHRRKTSYQHIFERHRSLNSEKSSVNRRFIESSRSISNNVEGKSYSTESNSDHSNSFDETYASADRESTEELNTLKNANAFWVKNRVHPSLGDIANRLCDKQEQQQNTVVSKLQESVAFGHPLYNDLIFNPNTQSLVDLNYAYNLRAAGSLPFPHIPIQISAFSNASNVAAAASELLKTRRFNLNCSAQLHESYQRCKLLEQCYSDNANHRLLLHPSFRPAPVSSSENEDFNNSSPDFIGREEHHSSSSLPLSPTFSESCAMSPSTDERPIQLPAYLRSRLGGSSSSESANGENGKMKKCRRSRTVFTELQMLGLEKRFEKQQYLSTPDRVELAELLGLSQLQVKTWYQNRRMKWKKQVMQAGGTEPPTKQKGRPRKIRPGEENSSQKSASESIPLMNNEKATDFSSANE